MSTSSTLGLYQLEKVGTLGRVRADRYIMKLLYYEPLYMAENKWGFHCRYFTCMGGVLSCVIKWDPSVCGEQTRYKCCWSGGFPGKKQRMKFGLVVTPIFLLGRVQPGPWRVVCSLKFHSKSLWKMGRAPKGIFIFQLIDFPGRNMLVSGEGGRLCKMIFPSPSQKWGNKTRGAYFCERFFAIFLAIFAMIATKTKFMTLSEGWKR